MKNNLEQKLARELALAFTKGNVLPARDTIAEAVKKFQRQNLRHLLVTTDTGGLLCLCADPEMSKRLVDAIHSIDEECEWRDEPTRPLMIKHVVTAEAQ